MHTFLFIHSSVDGHKGFCFTKSGTYYFFYGFWVCAMLKIFPVPRLQFLIFPKTFIRFNFHLDLTLMYNVRDWVSLFFSNIGPIFLSHSSERPPVSKTKFSFTCALVFGLHTLIQGYIYSPISYCLITVLVGQVLFTFLFHKFPSYS